MNYNLVIGASENPDRYSNKAIKELKHHNLPVLALSQSKGHVLDVTFITDIQDIINNDTYPIDTVTMYMNPTRQVALEDDIIALAPRRVIFNPGTENPPFYNKLEDKGIEVLEACTLVLLATGQYN